MSAALSLALALVSQDPATCERLPHEVYASEAQFEVNCFVGWIYSPGTLETLTPLGADAPAIFSRSALDAMDNARSRAPDGRHPAFDADPVCQCQDPTGLRLISMTVPEASTNRAMAHVVFDFGRGGGVTGPEDQTHVTLMLTKEDGQWRIDDLISSGSSFRASLTGD
jgi:hypothetical protein